MNPGCSCKQQCVAMRQSRRATASHRAPATGTAAAVTWSAAARCARPSRSACTAWSAAASAACPSPPIGPTPTATHAPITSACLVRSLAFCPALSPIVLLITGMEGATQHVACFLLTSATPEVALCRRRRSLQSVSRAPHSGGTIASSFGCYGATSHYRRGTAVGHGSMYLMRLGVQGPVQVTPARC